MLYAKRRGAPSLRRFHDIVFERFWKRELDIEDIATICARADRGRRRRCRLPRLPRPGGPAELDGICRAAEASGVFGVPSFVVDGELFWGREHLPDIREILAGRPQTNLTAPPG